ncbi:hypothetical protein D1AOALGA4SA_8227 [Olavius algarvensis Delta 1 endosymbiont]|nr:hypothetical protein D1AOALGA4SA_8227 [Olavius algarvensis Delta 1 endosymbiont]
MNFVSKKIQPRMNTNQHELSLQLENWSTKIGDRNFVSIRANSWLFSN